MALHLLAAVLVPWLAAPLALLLGRRAGLGISVMTAAAQFVLTVLASSEDSIQMGGVQLLVQPLDRLFIPLILIGFVGACALGERESRAVAPTALLVNGAAIGGTLVTNPFLASLFLQLAGVCVLFMLPARTPAATTLVREALAGSKYLTLTAVSALGLLAAFALIETTRIAGETRTIAQVVLALLVIGIGLRIAAFPFQMWLPDFAFIAPPAAVVLACAVINLTAIVLVFSTLADAPWLVLPERNRAIMAVGAVVTAAGGALLALNANDLRRLIVYGSSAELGFVLYGISVGSGSSVTAAVAVLVANLLAVVMLWALVGQLERRVGSVEIGSPLGLIAQLPGTALAFLAASLTIGGVPLFAAFPGRWVLARLAVDSNPWLALGLSAVNLMLLFAFLRAFRAIFLGRPPAEVVARESLGATVGLLLLALISLLLGLLPWLIFQPITAAVLELPFLQ